MEAAAHPIAFDPRWFLPALIVGMAAVAALLAYLSGWRRLARRFPPVAQIDGERFYFASAKMGLVPWFQINYGVCLIITVGRAGIYVSIFMPFRLLCPDFFLPWSAVEGIEEQSSALSRRTVVHIHGTRVTMALRGSLGHCVAATYAGALAAAQR